MTDRLSSGSRERSLGMVFVLAMFLPLTALACSSNKTPPKPPTGALVQGEPTWPEEITREAERSDRICNKRVTTLQFEQEQAKKEKEKFKTAIASVSGAVGTAGGTVSTVGAFVLEPADMKQLTVITGLATAGLGAAGTVVTLLVSPGEDKLKSMTASLDAIDKKRGQARELLTKKDPSTWTEEDKTAWAKVQQELADLCK
jgi:hypothetical protein